MPKTHIAFSLSFSYMFVPSLSWQIDRSEMETLPQSAVLRSALLCSAVACCAVPCCGVLRRAVLCAALRCCAVLCCGVLGCVALRFAASRARERSRPSKRQLKSVEGNRGPAVRAFLPCLALPAVRAVPLCCCALHCLHTCVSQHVLALAAS